MKLKSITTIAAATFALIYTAQAATSYTGAVTNTGGSTYDYTTGATTGDADGDGALGTDGYYFAQFGGTTGVNGLAWDNNMVSSTPGYVSSVTQNAGVSSAGGWGYDTVTNSAAGTGQLGVFELEGGAAGNEVQFFEFTLGASTPDTISIGLTVDGSDLGGVFTPTDLRVDHLNSANVSQGDVSQAAGGEGTFESADHYFFNVTGAVAGDKIRIYATNNGDTGTGSRTQLHINAITFDSVPEPSSTALLGLGGLALILRRRK